MRMAKVCAIERAGNGSGPRIDSDPTPSWEFERWPMHVKLWLE